MLYAPGLKKIGLGGSLLNDLYGEIGDDLPKVNLKQLRTGWLNYHLMLKQLGRSQSIRSRSVVAEGGLIRRLFEMSLGSGLGCRIYFDIDIGIKPLYWLCGELNTAIVFTASARSLNWSKFLGKEDYRILGAVTAEPVINVHSYGRWFFQCPIEVLAEKWQKTFKEAIG
ncbi:MAG: hypothetical protein HYV53_02430 [Parcubacteria group bacterium]|nr:hypothetical protein [Parcubacteria group bacterium]